MNREDFLAYIGNRIAIDRRAMELMKAEKMQTFTNGKNHTQHSIEALEKDIPAMEALQAWILDK